MCHLRHHGRTQRAIHSGKQVRDRDREQVVQGHLVSKKQNKRTKQRQTRRHRDRRDGRARGVAGWVTKVKGRIVTNMPVTDDDENGWDDGTVGRA